MSDIELPRNAKPSVPFPSYSFITHKQGVCPRV